MLPLCVLARSVRMNNQIATRWAGFFTKELQY
jgi:hypothetical protein